MRRSTWWVVCGIVLCAAIAVPAFSGDRTGGEMTDAASIDPVTDAAEVSAEQARILRGFEIAPVPLRNRRSPLVGLGSYLVNAGGGCNDCHTNPPYAPGGRELCTPSAVAPGCPVFAGGGATAIVPMNGCSGTTMSFVKNATGLPFSVPVRIRRAAPTGGLSVAIVPGYDEASTPVAGPELLIP